VGSHRSGGVGGGSASDQGTETIFVGEERKVKKCEGGARCVRVLEFVELTNGISKGWKEGARLSWLVGLCVCGGGGGRGAPDKGVSEGFSRLTGDGQLNLHDLHGKCYANEGASSPRERTVYQKEAKGCRWASSPIVVGFKRKL